MYIANRFVSGEIYTAGKNFTLPLAVTALTNFTSVTTTYRLDLHQKRSQTMTFDLPMKMESKIDFDFNFNFDT